MPTYCHSCPYNAKFCKDIYIDQPTCPHGYSPLKQNSGQKTVSKQLNESGQKKMGILESNILIKIGKAAANIGEYQTAKECYQKVFEIEPTNNEAAFLLKRIIYILESNKKDINKDPVTKDIQQNHEKKSTGMLPQQEEKKISIRPKQMFEIDPNIIDKDQEGVYHVEGEEDESELEEVSRHVARELTKSSKKEKRNMGLAAGIIVILMMIVLLWYFGYLNF